MGIRYLFDTYIPICDRWVLADNTQSPFVVVAEGNKDGINIKDEEKYNIIKEIAHPTKKDEQ